MYFAGLLNTEDLVKFQRMVFRFSRGNVIIKTKDIGSVKTIFDHLGGAYKTLRELDLEVPCLYC
jgi:hypothetical protein